MAVGNRPVVEDCYKHLLVPTILKCNLEVPYIDKHSLRIGDLSCKLPDYPDHRYSDKPGHLKKAR